MAGPPQKYSAPFLAEGRVYITAKGEKTKVIRISIETISGKARRN